MDINAHLLAEECKERGFSINWVSSDCFFVQVDGIWLGFWGAKFNSLANRRILNDRSVTRKLVKNCGLSVPRAKVFDTNKPRSAQKYAVSLSNPVLLKSVDTKGSISLCINPSEPEEFKEQWRALKEFSKQGIFVEEQIQNSLKARFLVINGKCAAVCQILPPTLTGNGEDSITKLAEKINRQNALDTYLKNYLIPLDSEQVRVIRNQGYQLNDILPAGKTIVLDYRTRMAVGSEPHDITDKVHNTFIELAERASQLISGLKIVGIDIETKNFTTQITDNNYIVRDVTTQPDIGGHHYPVTGTPRNIARQIVDLSINRLKTQQNIYLSSSAGSATHTTTDPALKPQNTYSTDSDSITSNMSSQLIADEFNRLGFKVQWLDDVQFIVHVKDKRIGFRGSNLNSVVGCRVTKNKALSNTLFAQSGISVATGKVFGLADKESAAEYAAGLTKPAVIKPVDGTKARGNTVGVQGKAEFDRAWEKAKKTTKKGIIVEEQFQNGTEARLLVIGRRCVAVFKKNAPSVIGNGIDTVEALIEQKNKERMANPHLSQQLIVLDNHRIDIIRSQGFELSSTPGQGEEIFIDWKASTATGGDSVDVTDWVHPSYKEIAERVASVVDGLHTAGMDILAHDFHQPATRENHIVIEANSRPIIGGHHFPAYGTPRNVAVEIVRFSLKLHGVSFLTLLQSRIKAMVKKPSNRHF